MNSSLLPLHEVTLYLLQTTWPKVNDWQIKIRAAVFRYDAFCYIIRQYHQYPDVTLLTKIRLVKAIVFPVVMYGCESWSVKIAERQIVDAFELWVWRRLLRVPWTARGSNQSILKEISPEYSLEGLRLKLQLQYFGHLMGRTDSFEKTLLLGKVEGGRRRERQRMRWLDASPTQWT